MATRKAEQARRRAERLEAERRAAAAARRRLIFGYVAAGILTAAVVVGIVIAVAGGGDGSEQVGGEDIPAEARVATQTGYVHDVAPDGRTGTPPPAVEQADLQRAAQQARCDLRLDLRDEGSDHLQSDFPDYGTEPPTSGDHHSEQQADGAYSEQVPPQYAVHALEHGRIEIQYSPDLPEEDQLAIKGVFDEDPAGILLHPNPDMDYELAVAAWTQLLGCPTYEGAATLDAIRAFRDTYRGRGPENFPIVVAG